MAAPPTMCVQVGTKPRGLCYVVNFNTSTHLRPTRPQTTIILPQPFIIWGARSRHDVGRGSPAIYSYIADNFYGHEFPKVSFNLLALGTTQISSYFTKHWTKFLTHQTGNCPVTCCISKPSRIAQGENCLSLPRVTNSFLLALGTTQISSYFTKHWTQFLTHQTRNYPVTPVPEPSCTGNNVTNLARKVA